MYHLEYAEFYITNVCNLNCTNCNRFNNFVFKGHKKWKDHYFDHYKWAKILHIDKIGILGGEPLLNPDFSNWFNGLCNLWPTSDIVVITNGTMLTKFKNLFDLLNSVSNTVTLEINCHDLDCKTLYEQQIEKLIGAEATKTHVNDKISNYYWNKSYNAIKDPSWPECQKFHDFENLPVHIQEECINSFGFSPKIHKLKFEKIIFNKNNFSVEINPAASFNNSTIIHDYSTNTLSLNKSDPDRAFEVCYFKKCHHFIGGKLYKCGPVAILPEFVEQFDVERDAEQDRLIHSYAAAHPDWESTDINNFLHNLKNNIPIEQCSLCPEKMVNTDFSATTKKIKISPKQ